MAGIPNQRTNLGVWLPSTYIFSEDIQENLVRLYQDVNNVITAVNMKTTGLYMNQETNNSKQWFIPQALNAPNVTQTRATFQITVLTGQLPNTGTTITPHGIPFTSTFTTTDIYGSATDHAGLNYISLDYASPVLANNIEVRVDRTNIYITTGSNRTNFDFSWITIEYLKN